MRRRQFLMQPLALALRTNKLEQAAELLQKATASGELSAAVLLVRQAGGSFARAFGKARSPQTVFLLASITKQMTAAAVMVLADRKELALSDPVRKFIPEFRGGDRDLVTVRQLLTHTSGLPDMLPENGALRRRHAPMAEFVALACSTPLLFRPGSEVSYQSMGILLAAEIARRITSMPFREFMRRAVFDPLAMQNSSLGLGGRRIEDTALCQVAGNDDWNWNSPYWRDFGAPWGGAHAPAGDVARFLEYFLKPDGRMVSIGTAAQMIVDQNKGLNEPRGIGFMVKPGSFGSQCSPRTFGHYGSTGTLAWADPDTGTVFVLLTTKPASDSRDKLLAPAADLAAEAAL